MLVVADTSPLNYLVWIELAETLPKLYGGVIIPPEVRDELVSPHAPSVVSAWAMDLPDWVEVRPLGRPFATICAGRRWMSVNAPHWRSPAP